MTGIQRERSLPVARADVGKRRRVRWRSIAGLLLPALVIALLIAGWEIGVRIDGTPRWFLPKPSNVGRELVESRALLWRHTWTTLQEMLIGLALAFVLGIALAVAIVGSQVVERAIYPLVIASQAVPIIALAPILLVWFGYGLTPKVIVVVLTCFFPIVVATVGGLRAVDPDAVALLRSMGASRWQLMRIVRIPSALPALLAGTRIAAAWSVIGAIVGEWVGASSGLGYLMTRSASQFQTPRLYAAVVIAAVLGIGLFTLVSLVERFALPWQSRDRR